MNNWGPNPREGKSAGFKAEGMCAQVARGTASEIDTTLLP